MTALETGIESRSVSARVNAALAGSGLFVRGGFHPADTDKVTHLLDGNRPGTMLLVGNAGTALWEAFLAEGDLSVRHPLDSWIRSRIETAAAAVSAAKVLYPNSGPPWMPIQEWAEKAEPIYRSPIGIMIHPEFGLWHVYRAVLLFAERLALPDKQRVTNPCENCSTKPCLSVCPADAFEPDRFNVRACATHVGSAQGSPCRNRGCLARRACPVGRQFRYHREQQEFHMSSMLRTARRMIDTVE